MALAIFDLDNTLLAGDSDHAWGQFAGEHGRLDADRYGERNERFYQAYAELSGASLGAAPTPLTSPAPARFWE